jgi:uncharacterized protein
MSESACDASSESPVFDVRVVDRIGEVPADAWNALGVRAYPFLRHEFLAALEEHGCVGERYGWLPQHLVVRDGRGRMVGACPLYLKDNSYGEFVFDWSWADAYARNGLRYYPKLVSASPYTPATGPKLLVAEDQDDALADHLVDAATHLASSNGLSSVHWLFPPAAETARLENSGQLVRHGCQFHWQNRGYADFEDFLASLTSGKRKNIRKERRKVIDAGIGFRWLDGASATETDWHIFHRFYESTFHRRGGIPTLSLDFFLALAENLPDGVLLVMAEHEAKPVAASFCLVGEDTLYGRHWGCDGYYDNLHFEACYYQGLEFAIRRGMRRFEPGAQGEHKVPRGFLPETTYSAHWIADERFRHAIGRFLEDEREGVAEYAREMRSRSPYRQD